MSKVFVFPILFLSLITLYQVVAAVDTFAFKNLVTIPPSGTDLIVAPLERAPPATQVTIFGDFSVSFGLIQICLLTQENYNKYKAQGFLYCTQQWSNLNDNDSSEMKMMSLEEYGKITPTRVILNKRHRFTYTTNDDRSMYFVVNNGIINANATYSFIGYSDANTGPAPAPRNCFAWAPVSGIGAFVFVGAIVLVAILIVRDQKRRKALQMQQQAPLINRTQQIPQQQQQPQPYYPSYQTVVPPTQQQKQQPHQNFYPQVYPTAYYQQAVNNQQQQQQ